MRPYYFFGRERGLTQLFDGEVFFVDTDALDISPWIVFGGRWETFVDDILCALAKPGGCFIDIGANQGYYTVKLATRLGEQGKVFAYEPNPRMAKLVATNIRINGYGGRAQVANIALGDQPGEFRLVVDPEWPGGGSVLLADEQPSPGLQVHTVQVRPLDAVLPEHCCPDLIKIDVEGFEPLVFKGMQRTLERSQSAAIVTEVSFGHWARFGDPVAQLAELSCGRRLIRIQLTGQLTEMPVDRIGSFLSRDFVSYVLLIRPDDPRIARLSKFMANGTPAKLSQPPSGPELAPPILDAGPGRAPSFLSRIRRRIAGWGHTRLA